MAANSSSLQIGHLCGGEASSTSEIKWWSGQSLAIDPLFGRTNQIMPKMCDGLKGSNLSEHPVGSNYFTVLCNLHAGVSES